MEHMLPGALSNGLTGLLGAVARYSIVIRGDGEMGFRKELGQMRQSNHDCTLHRLALAQKIWAETGRPGVPDRQCIRSIGCIAVLALVRVKRQANENVHDAWSAVAGWHRAEPPITGSHSIS